MYVGIDVVIVREPLSQHGLLQGTDLYGAAVTNEQLATAKSLKGATMPAGTKHEWP